MSDIRSVTLERRVLGGIISNPKAFLSHPIFDQLTPEDFSNGHVAIFNVLRGQISNNGQVDTAILTEKIKNLGIDLNGKSDKEVYEYLESISFKKATEEVLVEAAKELKTVSLRREIRDCVKNIMKQMEDCGGLTPNQIISLADGLYNERINSYQLTEQPEDLFERIVEDLEELGNNPIIEIGLSTPYDEFNKQIGGLVPGNVYSFVSRSGDGKSTFLSDLIIKTCKQHNTHALILDTEMQKQRNAHRAAANITGIPFWYLRTGNWAKNQSFVEIWNKKKSELESYKNRVSHLYVANKPIQEIESMIRRWRLGKIGRGVENVLVDLDYIKLAGESDRNKKEYELIGEKCSKFKDIMVDLETIGGTAGQANRAGAGQNPVDDDSVIASSDRFIWFFDYVGLFRLKTHVEVAEDSIEFGTHKLIHLKTRDQGREAAGHQNLVKVTKKNSKGKDYIAYQENFINFQVENFRVTERGTLKDIIESQSNGQVDLATKKEKEEPSF